MGKFEVKVLFSSSRSMVRSDLALGNSRSAGAVS